jgi:hypothetical protein
MPPIPLRALHRLCFALLLSSLISLNIIAQDLSQFRWKNRVLQIETPSIKDPLFQAQSAALVAVFEGLLDRDLVILTSTDADEFRITLVGKDGGTKLTRSTILPAQELFAIIDAMPMRRDEMRRDSTSAKN